VPFANAGSPQDRTVSGSASACSISPSTGSASGA